MVRHESLHDTLEEAQAAIEEMVGKSRPYHTNRGHLRIVERTTIVEEVLYR